MPPAKEDDTTYQARILAQLTILAGKVEQSLEQGRENGNELKMLRRELGLDGQHGRLPLVEAMLVRHEARMDKTDQHVEKLEIEKNQSDGRVKLLSTTLSLLGGGAGGALIALVAHLLGIR